jgi:ABC-type antimicrobial peptide transport system permease subunit
LLGLFSLLALVLAGLGVYGVLASSVAERRREIGIRLALGAGRASVAGLIMRRTLTLASIGVVLGTIGGLAVTRVLAKLLFGVTPTDLTTFLGAASVLVAVAVASSLIPARHASTVDPLLSLKAE